MTDLIATLQAAAGNAAGEGLYVEEVFSTYLYTGTGSNQTITNGVDLDGEGGLVWGKCRSTSRIHALYDTERGVKNRLRTNDTNAEDSNIEGVTSFNSNGFTLGTDAQTNFNGNTFASWTFRKAPKFFDVVTYTGTGTSQAISHNLGSAPGCLMIKRTDSASNWFVYHRGLTSAGYGVNLNTTAAQSVINWFNFTAPTSTQFLANGDANTSGGTYVAYLFAHNDGDGEFGENADQDIIKCGSVNASSDFTLPWEPQWILSKDVNRTGDWHIIDNMRGFVASGNNDAYLEANNSNAEQTAGWFDINGNTLTNRSGGNIIYIAIRRGPMKTPESGTEVFAMDFRNSTEAQALNPKHQYYSGFPVDMHWNLRRSSGGVYAYSRLQGGSNFLQLSNTNAEVASSTSQFDSNKGLYPLGVTNSEDTTQLGHMFRRAPGFFDVVAYEGNGTAGRNVSHNLGVVPEMMIVKNRDTAGYGFAVYSEAVGNTAMLQLNNTNDINVNSVWWNNTSPTSSVFSVGSNQFVNESGDDYIAYLFATVAGVSKVGSYTGNGTSQTIDCGFSAGARFVMTRRYGDTGNWNVWDSERGIIAGNDPRLELNTTDAEDTGHDYIDPDSSGFVVNYVADDDDDSNVSGDTYIFLAIA